MSYEVEQKFPVSDLHGLQSRFSELGIRHLTTLRQVDIYLAHPQRDFAETDEALRIRSVGDENCITYKGPKLDATTKTRREIEFSIGSGAQGVLQGVELFESLGFSHVREVSKTREIYHTQFENHSFELSIDQVDGLGQYVELEVVVEDQGQLDAARDAMASLAKLLGLQGSERRGYLDMLLEQGQN